MSFSYGATTRPVIYHLLLKCWKKNRVLLGIMESIYSKRRGQKGHYFGTGLVAKEEGVLIVPVSPSDKHSIVKELPL